MAKELNDGNFAAEITGASVPVVVDFWAPWCGPCRSQGPIIEAFEQAEGDKVKVCKVNVDDNQGLASQYGVMSIPTIIVFKEGVPAGRAVGLQSQENLKKLAGI